MVPYEERPRENVDPPLESAATGGPLPGVGVAGLRVLVVDDHDGVRGRLADMLRAHGARVEVGADLGAAQQCLQRHAAGWFDVILLDLTLPDGLGWELLEALRAQGDTTPVVFLSGSRESADRVRGLRLGASDFVAKPFSQQELLARIEAAVRAHRQLPVLVHEDLRLDLGRRRATRDGRPLELSPREFDVLRMLVEARGTPVSRERLLAEVWELSFEPGTNVVEVLLTRLRKKVERHGRPLIQTVPGEGYRVDGRSAAPDRAAGDA